MQTPKPPAAPPAPPSPQRRWSSQQLFGSAGTTVIEIEHQQQIYQLRQTAQGKLILTK